MSTPLTCLSDDEVMFRDAVRQFAASEVLPKVAAMERAAAFDRSLIPQFAELGLMGIDIPADLGGAGGTFFMSVLAVEELSRVDASTAILVDVQNTLVNAPLLAWGSDDVKRRYLPQLALVALIPLAILAFVFPQDWISALVLLLSAPLIPLFMVLVGDGAERLNQRQWQKLARMRPAPAAIFCM